MQEHDLAHQREPDAEAALLAIGRMVGLGEEIEHLRQHVRVDADAGVGDADDRLTGAVAVVPGPVDRELDPPAVAGVLDRVGEQVADHLGEPDRVADGDQRTVGQHALEPLPPLGGERPGGLQRAPDDVGEVDPLGAQRDLAARDARDVEEIVDEPDEVADLPAEHVERRREQRLGRRRELHELHRVRDRRERVAQLVRERRQELVLAPVGLAQRLLAADALGEVDADADAAADAVRFVEERPGMDHHLPRRPVRAVDLDLGVVHRDAARNAGVHRQLGGRDVDTAAAQGEARRPGLGERGVRLRRNLQQLGERAVDADGVAARIVGDGDADRHQVDERLELLDPLQERDVQQPPALLRPPPLGVLGLERGVRLGEPEVRLLEGAVERLQLARAFRLEARVGVRELDVRLLERAVQPLELLALGVQLGEHLHLAAQDLRHDRHVDVVERRRARSRAGGRGRSRAPR